MSKPPNQIALETAVGAGYLVVAVPVASRRWRRFFSLGIERMKQSRITRMVLTTLVLLLLGAGLPVYQAERHGFFDYWFEWSRSDWALRYNYGCETSRGTVAGEDYRNYFGHYIQVGPFCVAYYPN